MKTALEILGTDFDSKAEVIASDGPPLGRPLGQVTYQLTVEQLERFARRVREDFVATINGPLPVASPEQPRGVRVGDVWREGPRIVDVLEVGATFVAVKSRPRKRRRRTIRGLRTRIFRGTFVARFTFVGRPGVTPTGCDVCAPSTGFPGPEVLGCMACGYTRRAR